MPSRKTPQDSEPHPAEIIDTLLERPEPSHVRPSDGIDAFIRTIGHAVCWLNAALLVAIMTQVILRYVFANGQTALEELQWHLYGTAVMMGLSYALVNDSHVRVDILYARFSDRTKRLVDVIAMILFVLPFAFVIFHHSLPFVADAWRVNEASDSAGGLPYRFLIKSVIPISFGLVILAAFSRLVRSGHLLVRGG